MRAVLQRVAVEGPLRPGLNIAALLCDKHGGSLTLGNRAEGGARTTARFALNFPAVDNQ